MARLLNEYAVYKGEELVAMGTARECAEKLGVKVGTIKFYTTPTYRKRIENRKTGYSCGYMAVVKLDPDDEQ